MGTLLRPTHRLVQDPGGALAEQVFGSNAQVVVRPPGTDPGQRGTHQRLPDLGHIVFAHRSAEQVHDAVGVHAQRSFPQLPHGRVRRLRPLRASCCLARPGLRRLHRMAFVAVGVGNCPRRLCRGHALQEQSAHRLQPCEVGLAVSPVLPFPMP